MTQAVVVDTNVPIIANGGQSHTDTECELACVRELRRVQRNGCVLIDANGLIVAEYRRHLSHRGQPGPGDAFFKWLWENQGNAKHCTRVAITPCGPDDTDFAEFPSDPSLVGFDRSDRKFVAVALASGTSPEILNATDTDWWMHREALERNGLRVRFLCPQHMST